MVAFLSFGAFIMFLVSLYTNTVEGRFNDELSWLLEENKELKATVASLNAELELPDHMQANITESDLQDLRKKLLFYKQHCASMEADIKQLRYLAGLQKELQNEH